MAETQNSAQERVWRIVREIPPGRVATYGQIASLAGMPTHARLVGRILRGLPTGTFLPWHRVVNSQGRITSPDKAEQRTRLQAEGIISVSGRINLGQYAWRV